MKNTHEICSFFVSGGGGGDIFIPIESRPRMLNLFSLNLELMTIISSPKYGFSHLNLIVLYFKVLRLTYIGVFVQYCFVFPLIFRLNMFLMGSNLGQQVQFRTNVEPLSYYEWCRAGLRIRIRRNLYYFWKLDPDPHGSQNLGGLKAQNGAV